MKLDHPQLRQSATSHHGPNLPPGPATKLDFGATQRDPLGFLLDLTTHYGDLVRYETAYGATYLVNDPEHIGHVLNNANYPRGSLLTMVLGDGLLASEGDYWRRQRRMVQPDFHHHRIAGFAQVVTSATLKMLDRWQRHMSEGEPVELASEMARLTLDIIIEALFSGDLQEQAKTLREAVTPLMMDIGSIVCTQFGSPLSISRSRNARFQATLRTVDQIVYSAIRERRQRSGGGFDLLSLLLSVRDEDGEGLDDRQVRDEVVTFVFAGSETSSLMLGWTWYLLASHPDVERRLKAELDAVLCGRAPDFRDLIELKYTRMVIEESLRLYPPVWSIFRQAEAEDMLGGCRVTAKASMVVSPYTMHRHPRYWPDPDRFDPERFAPEVSATRPRNAYLPFGGGRHVCLGNYFAMMEGQLIIATVAQHYRLRLVPGHPVEPHPLVTLRQRHGIMATLDPR